MKNKEVVAIIGPTAVGKTALSLKLAHIFQGEIINGDAMQVYKGFHIGTAKISKKEMQGISHHLFDICTVDEAYNVARFQKDVRQKIEEIHARGHLPILVGGTGLYIQAALYNFQFHSVKPTSATMRRRKELEMLAEREGAFRLYQILSSFPKEKIPHDLHPNNVKRVIRTIEKLENAECVGMQPQALQPYYSVHLFGLTMDREKLYARINQRVDMMMKEGLLEEAKALYASPQKSKDGLFAAIGYKEFFPYFENEITLQEAIEKIKKNSRNYAKRQLTYFRNKMNVTWISVETPLSEVDFEHYFSFLGRKV